MAAHAIQQWETGNNESDLVWAALNAADTVNMPESDPNVGILIRNTGAPIRQLTIGNKRDQPKEHPHGWCGRHDFIVDVPGNSTVIIKPSWWIYVTVVSKNIDFTVVGVSLEIAYCRFPCPAILFGTPAFEIYKGQT